MQLAICMDFREITFRSTTFFPTYESIHLGWQRVRPRDLFLHGRIHIYFAREDQHEPVSIKNIPYIGALLTKKIEERPVEEKKDVTSPLLKMLSRIRWEPSWVRLPKKPLLTMNDHHPSEIERSEFQVNMNLILFTRLTLIENISWR